MSKKVWANDDIWNITNLNINILETYYPDITRNHLNTLKRYYIKRGDKVERSEPYNPETELQKVADRRKIGETALSHLITPEDRERYHKDLDRALDEYGAVQKATFTDWAMGYKDKEGEAQALPLHGTRFEVKFDHEPKWPIVTRVESENLPRKETRKETKSKTAIILPDLQIPFADEKAVSVALQIIRDKKPSKVILLGDALDLSAWSKYEQRPEYATATQDAIIQLHKLLVTIRKLVPQAEIKVLSGNHEARMSTALLRNAQAAYGLKRADQLDGWPVMSVPYLAAFDTIGVEYIDGYPANRLWINERLQVRHGNIARPGGKTAVAIANDEKVSTIFGHIHRIESQFKTVNVYSGGRTSAAYGIGCLCRIDGHVPSTKSGFDSFTNLPVTNYENWTQGLAVVSYEEGDAPFSVEQVYINTFDGHSARYNGKTYRP